MSKLAKAMAVVMLAFYGLAILHCDLEQVPGFDFLSCCDHPDTPPHQDTDCQQDACSVVETGFYKTSESDAAAPMPVLVLSYLLPGLRAEPPSYPALFLELSCAPAELPRIWQFSFRTALPPRAPSIAS